MARKRTIDLRSALLAGACVGRRRRRRRTGAAARRGGADRAAARRRAARAALGRRAQHDGGVREREPVGRVHHHRAARPRLLQPQRHARAAGHGLGFHLGRAGPRRHEFSCDPRRAGGARQARRSAQLSARGSSARAPSTISPCCRSMSPPTCPRRLRSAAARSCVSARPCSRSAIRSASITR